MRDINNALDKLTSSFNEEEVISHLKTIIKTFNLNEYQEHICSNPLFKSIIIDIKPDILNDIRYHRNKIENEILTIENELKNINDIDINIELKNLKFNCIHMINQLKIKEDDLNKL